jgi:hypothetical protein
MFIRSYRVSNLLIWTCVASNVDFCLFDWTFPNIALIHALATMGRWLCKKCYWMYLEGFRVVSSHLWALVVPRWSSAWLVEGTVLTSVGVRTCAMWCTGLTGEVYWIQNWAGTAILFCENVCMHSSRGSCIGSGGACMCVVGALFGFRGLDWLFVLFAWACFCLGCLELLPLPKGTETFLIQVILFFAFILAFDHLFEFLCLVLFIFLYMMCVFSMHWS